jgi:hypothetical protein
MIGLAACDGGFAPPEEAQVGAIRGQVFYSGPWPSPDSLVELRFVGMRFIPRDTADFLQLNRLVISEDTLARFVERDSFYIANVEAGPIVYSGIAEKFGDGLLDWRPAGLYAEDDGVFDVRAGEVTEITVLVDFGIPRPPFPPQR